MRTLNLWRRPDPSLLKVAFRVALAATALGSAACLKTAPAVPGSNLNLSGAVDFIAKDLSDQMGFTIIRRDLVIDPFRDRASGQQTLATQKIEQDLAQALPNASRGLAILPFTGDGVAEARFVLSGTVGVAPAPDEYVLQVALTDRSSGIVVAQSAARFRQAGLDTSPTPFYRDSPTVVLDRSVEGYLRTAETPKGNRADPLYVEQVETAAILNQAAQAYDDGRWDAALTAYTSAVARPDGQQMRTFTGLYLSNVRLARLADAEAAFGQIVALGLATNNLAVKLLFVQGSSTEFWPGEGFADVYDIWLRQIARGVHSQNACLTIVGHTSRTGSEQLNDALSLARAETVRHRLEREVPALAGRLQTRGVGFRENIVGNGADNVTDALDRRVEFKVIPCANDPL